MKINAFCFVYCILITFDLLKLNSNIKQVKMKRIAIFASGSGSNAENIDHYFKKDLSVKIDLILSNNPKAFVLERAKKLGVDTMVFNRSDFYQSRRILEELKKRKIDLIVLAGFMWLVPPLYTNAFPDKMINIHPALLPKYGGKGMYGDFVHQAVSKAHEKETGITIHFVNDHYDEGNVIFQQSIPIKAGDHPELIAEKVHALEYEHYPRVIGEVLKRF